MADQATNFVLCLLFAGKRAAVFIAIQCNYLGAKVFAPLVVNAYCIVSCTEKALAFGSFCIEWQASAYIVDFVVTLGVDRKVVNVTWGSNS